MKFLWFAFVVLLLGSIGSCGSIFYIDWTAERDITSIAKRAYTASTAEESLDYLLELKQAIIDNGWDTGYTAFIFNTPGTDLSKKMRNLDSCIERMTSLAELERAGQMDMTYQLGMQEMIDEMGGPNGLVSQYSSVTLAYKKTFGLGWLFFIVLLLLIADIIWLAVEHDAYR